MTRLKLIFSVSALLVAVTVVTVWATTPSTPTTRKKSASKPLDSPQTAAKKSAEVKPPLFTDDRTKFVQQFRPSLHAAHNKRFAQYKQHVAALEKNIRACKNHWGIDAFVDEATSLTNKALLATDQTAYRRKIRQLFLDEVLQIDQMREVIRVQSTSLEAACNDIDQNVLIDLGEGDAELKPIKPRFASISLEPVLQEVDRVVDQVCDRLYEELAKSAVSVAAGMGAGAAGHGFAKQRFSQDGEYSLFDSIVALGVGVATDVVVTELADDLMETDETLKNAVSLLADEVIDSCVKPNGSANTALQSGFSGLLQDHTNRMLYAVTDALGVDRDWARSVY